MSLTDALLVFGTALLSALTLIPLSRHEAWWVRSLDFPRLQLFIASSGLLVLQLVALELTHPKAWVLLAAGALCLGYHLWWIVPYTPVAPVEVKSAKHADRRRVIRILSANVLMENRNADGLIELVRENRPDVLVTLETDLWWEEQLRPLEAQYPHTIKCPLDNRYGMHVYSRLPLSESRVAFLVEDDVPSMHALVQLPSGHKVRIHFLHPTPPFPTESETSAERDAELVIVGRSASSSDLPVIVTGDLNDVAWSSTTRLFRKISGLLDPRVGRGMFNTFHASCWLMRWPLDHLFHSRHFTLSSLRRLRSFGSDHFPLWSELVLEPGRSDDRGLEADGEDIAWAKEKIEDQGVSERDVPQMGRESQRH